jgi:hypothetical protein
MNTRSLWIASLSGALLTTLVSNLPLLGFVNCVLCAWFWMGGIFAVWLYRRQSGMPTVGQGARIGLLTGVMAGAMGFLLSFAGLAGFQGLRNAIPAEAAQGMADIPAWGSIVFNLLGVMFNMIFGTLGGWLGATLFNRQPKAASAVG